jgi:putative sporulation protein YyaC
MAVTYTTPEDKLRIKVEDPLASFRLSTRLNECIYSLKSIRPRFTILCIGSDRSTGDALGPLVGSRLKTKECEFMQVYGTLDEPVHAINLQDVLVNLLSCPSTIIAIDACLGKVTNVGTINANVGPLSPGAGVKKVLPQVGDIHITGTVNIKGFMEYAVLQNTRLSLVVKMADIISDGIIKTLPTFIRVCSTAEITEIKYC